MSFGDGIRESFQATLDTLIVSRLRKLKMEVCHDKILSSRVQAAGDLPTSSGSQSTEDLFCLRCARDFRIRSKEKTRREDRERHLRIGNSLS